MTRCFFLTLKRNTQLKMEVDRKVLSLQCFHFITGIGQWRKHSMKRQKKKGKKKNENKNADQPPKQTNTAFYLFSLQIYVM